MEQVTNFVKLMAPACLGWGQSLKNTKSFMFYKLCINICYIGQESVATIEKI